MVSLHYVQHQLDLFVIRILLEYAMQLRPIAHSTPLFSTAVSHSRLSLVQYTSDSQIRYVLFCKVYFRLYTSSLVAKQLKESRLPKS